MKDTAVNNSARLRDYTFSELLEFIGTVDKGDNSLECIAFTPAADMFTDFKTYRFCAKKNLPPETELLRSSEAAQKLERFVQFGMQPYDVSVRNIEKEHFSVRIMFKPTDPSSDPCSAVDFLLSLFSEYISDSIQIKALRALDELEMCTSNPLIQIGIELDESGELMNLKSYYSLKADYDENSRRKPPSRSALDTFMSRMSDSKTVIPILDDALELFGEMFVPHLIGLNCGAGRQSEVKLYSVAADLTAGALAANYSRYIASRLPGLCERERCEVFLRQLWNSNLYIKGAAAAGGRQGNQYKIYAAAIPKRMKL